MEFWVGFGISVGKYGVAPVVCTDTMDTWVSYHTAEVLGCFVVNLVYLSAGLSQAS